MKAMWERCGAQLVIQLIGVAIIALVALWLRSAVASQLDGYVTRNEFNELKSFVETGRKERAAFQVEVLQRLTAVETDTRSTKAGVERVEAILLKK